MGRARQPLCTPAALHELEELLKSEPPGWRRERLLVVQMGAKGEATLGEIAAAFGRARSAIQTWFEHMRRGEFAFMPGVDQNLMLAFHQQINVSDEGASTF